MTNFSVALHREQPGPKILISIFSLLDEAVKAKG
jgi:hypothetical protein